MQSNIWSMLLQEEIKNEKGDNRLGRTSTSIRWSYHPGWLSAKLLQASLESASWNATSSKVRTCLWAQWGWKWEEHLARIHGSTLPCFKVEIFPDYKITWCVLAVRRYWAWCPKRSCPVHCSYRILHVWVGKKNISEHWNSSLSLEQLLYSNASQRPLNCCVLNPLEVN